MNDDARSEKTYARDDALDDATDVSALMCCGKIHSRYDEQRRTEADCAQCPDARSLAMEVAVEADRRTGESRKAQSFENLQVVHCGAYSLIIARASSTMSFGTEYKSFSRV